MRAILINPFDETVTEIEHDASSYKNIYDEISTPTHQVDTFTCHYPSEPLPDGDAVFVDDEGLLKGPTCFFAIDGYPLAGCGLILGSDSMGETAPAKAELANVKERVKFLGHGEAAVPPPLVIAF